MSSFDIKQLDGEAPIMLELYGIQSNPSLPSLTGPLWPGVGVPDRVLSISHIELFDIQNVKTNDLWKIKLSEIELFDHLTGCKNDWHLI